jgi:hypothetical protein
MNAIVKPKVTIVRERYSQRLCEELLPLLKKNWVRTESYIGGLEVDPDFERYKRLDAMDMVTCVTARIEGLLIGYAIYFTSFSSHHKTVKTGHGDMIYVEDEPGMGHIVFDLLKECERLQRAANVFCTGWFVRKESRFYAILRSRGYVDDEIMMEKKL